jgi:hypothetical protein
LEEKAMIEDGSWILYVEAAGALALLIFIVWWTMPSKKKKPVEPVKPVPPAPPKP